MRIVALDIALRQIVTLWQTKRSVSSARRTYYQDQQTPTVDPQPRRFAVIKPSPEPDRLRATMYSIYFEAIPPAWAD